MLSQPPGRCECPRLIATIQSAPVAQTSDAHAASSQRFTGQPFAAFDRGSNQDLMVASGSIQKEQKAIQVRLRMLEQFPREDPVQHHQSIANVAGELRMRMHQRMAKLEEHVARDPDLTASLRKYVSFKFQELSN